VGIIGSSGLGKTHLLHDAFNDFSLCRDFICIYVHAESFDSEQLVDRWVRSVLASYLSHAAHPLESRDFNALLAACESLIPRTVEAVLQLQKSIRKESHEQATRQLFALTGVLSQETGKKVILMLDEFQCLENLPVHDPFGALGKEIMVETNTLYLVTSSHPERAREIFREKLSLLFANFEVIELTAFDFQETADYLAFHFPKTQFTRQQKKFFITMTNGEPLYLDLLMDRLKFYVSPEQDQWVSDRLVFTAFHEELLDHKGRIALLFEKMLLPILRGNKENAPYLKTLLAISEGRHRLAAIAGFIGRKMADTKKILQRLVQEDCVRKRGTFYTIEDRLFRFWLKEVFARKTHEFQPCEKRAGDELHEVLREVFERIQHEENTLVSVHAERLFKEFRNDAVEIDGKKWKCPQFNEIHYRPGHARFPSLIMRQQGVRWLCQIAEHYVREEDILAFLEDVKRSRTRIRTKILVALAGIDQNARLMAQTANVQLWGLRDFNCLLELYDFPKIMIFDNEEKHGAVMGTVAESVYPS